MEDICFEYLIADTKRRLDVIANNIHNIDWKYFADKKPDFSDKDQSLKIKEAMAIAAVRVLVPYASPEHAFWSRGIAGELSATWVTYPALVDKYLGGVATATYSELAKLYIPSPST